MKIVNFVKAIGPNCSLKIIGIRPGEKLHETMITEDDSRYTLELNDRYIIKPVISFGVMNIKLTERSFRKFRL